MLRFHVDYYKPEGKKAHPSPVRPWQKAVEAILAKHDTATAHRRSTPCWPPPASTTPLNTTACLTRFSKPKTRPRPRLCAAQHRLRRSRPAEGDGCAADSKTCPRKKETTRWDPRAKSRPQSHPGLLQRPLRHQPLVNEFDLYYQDVQKRIKDHQWPDADLRKGLSGGPAPQNRHHHRGGHAAHRFDSKYLNTCTWTKPQAPRLDTGVLAHQPRAQRHQALRQHPRLSPTANQRGRRHCPVLGEKRATKRARSGWWTKPRSSSKSWTPR